jgi:hypothetical protein
LKQEKSGGKRTEMEVDGGEKAVVGNLEFFFTKNF